MTGLWQLHWGGYLFSKEKRFSIKLSFFSVKLLKEVLSLGAPIGGTLFIELLFFSALAWVLGWYSARELAAYQVGYQFISMAFIFSFGFSQAVSVQLSNALGAGRGRDAKLSIISAITVSLIITIMIVILLWLLKTQIVGIILPFHSPVYNVVLSLIPIIGIVIILDGQQVILGAVCKALKAPAFVLYSGIISYWLIGALGVCIFLFDMKLGANGMLIGLSMGLTGYIILLAFKMEKLWPRYFKITK